VVSLPAGESR